MSFITNKPKTCQKNKKKPPPRPPPPNFAKYKSKSTYNLNDNLIEWSPPSSPKTERNHNFGGSVSSSFSSSTSSLASSKKSFECDISNNIWPINLHATSRTNYINNVPSKQFTNIKCNQLSSRTTEKSLNSNISPVFGPTIIRPRPTKIKAVRELVEDTQAISLPMPLIPPPSPPKNIDNEDIPYGVALYDFEARESNDLSFQVNDIIILLRKINNDWYFGKTQDREGVCPANFINVIVPLPYNDKDNTVMALHEFPAQMKGDLPLKIGQLVTVTRIINNDWLYGESNGQSGQFPSNFIDRIPNL